MNGFDITLEHYTAGSGEKTHRAIFRKLRTIVLNTSGFNMLFLDGSCITLGHGWGVKYEILPIHEEHAPPNEKRLVIESEKLNINDFFNFEDWDYPLDGNRDVQL